MPILVAALAILILAVTGAGALETFPSRPITMMNPFPPGGLADLTGPPLAAPMEKVLKQPVVMGAMEKIQPPIAYKDAEAFRAWWDAEAAHFAEVIKRIGRAEDK